MFSKINQDISESPCIVIIMHMQMIMMIILHSGLGFAIFICFPTPNAGQTFLGSPVHNFLALTSGCPSASHSHKL
jgi:hypothetical protein